MTDTDLLARVETMSAGGEMDELVATRIMGWRFHKADPTAVWVALHDDWWIVPYHDDSHPPRTMHTTIAPFSTDIREAWRVVEKMNTLGLPVTIHSPIRPATEWSAWFGGPVGEGNTAPLAICRAALHAVLAPQ